LLGRRTPQQPTQPASCPGVADRWLVRPDRDAHIIVIAEQLAPGQSIQMARLKEVVQQNARKAAADSETLEETQIPSAIPQALLLHSRGTAKGIPMEMYHGLFISERHVIQVIAFAQTRTFRDLEPELREIQQPAESVWEAALVQPRCSP
jgi:hypothetical protein